MLCVLPKEINENNPFAKSFSYENFLFYLTGWKSRILSLGVCNENKKFASNRHFQQKHLFGKKRHLRSFPY